jgi:hypothetical protein
VSSTESQPSEEQLRAAYEAQLKQIRVQDVLLEYVVALANLGMRRTGLEPGTESERDAAQVQLAIESIRALLPLLEGVAAGQAGKIRQALSQLQLAYVRIGGQARSAAASGASEPSRAGEPGGAGQGRPGAGAGGGEAGTRRQDPPVERPRPGEPGPAQRSGRLWVPGQ